MSNIIAFKSEIEKVMTVSSDAVEQIASLSDKGFKFFRVVQNGQATALVPLRVKQETAVVEQRTVSAELEETP